MSFIFVSHHSRDDAAACTLRDWLQKEGHAAVFLDHDTEAGIAGGEPWEERLYTELRRCRALIALVGPDWLASPWCVAEADHAQALRKLVLPLRIQPIDPVQYADKAPPVLRRVQSIDWDHSEEAHERLRRGLLTAGLDPRNSFVLRDDRPPYPGLATFQREDAAVYFGRRRLKSSRPSAQLWSLAWQSSRRKGGSCAGDYPGRRSLRRRGGWSRSSREPACLSLTKPQSRWRTKHCSAAGSL